MFKKALKGTLGATLLLVAATALGRVTSTTSRIAYTADGTLATYAYTFKVQANTDLLVTVKSSATPPVETTLTLTTDYTVSGVGSDSGGNVVLVDHDQSWLNTSGDLISGYTLVIRRVMPLTQSTSIRNQSTFYPALHENAFDKFMMVAQQLQSQLDRSIHGTETDSSSLSMALPAASTRASKYMAFDSSGQPTVSAGTTSDIVATPFAETLLDDTTASAMRTTLGFTGSSGTAPYSYSTSVGGSVAVSTDIVFALSSGVTYTLPDATTATGKVLLFVNLNTGFSTVTIDGYSSDTIDSSATTTINTEREMVALYCTGTTWYTLWRRIPQDWHTFTPTGTWSSNTTYSGRWRRVGSTMEEDILVTLSGAPTSAALQVDLPSSTPAIDTSAMNDSVAGVSMFPGSVAIYDSSVPERYIGGPIYYEDSNTVSIYKDDGDGTASTVTQAAPMTFATGDKVSIRVRGIPITGWKG